MTGDKTCVFAAECCLGIEILMFSLECSYIYSTALAVQEIMASMVMDFIDEISKLSSYFKSRIKNME